MSAADELALANAAVDLIAEFGRAALLVPPGSTNVDDAQPWKGKTAEGTPISVSVVFKEIRRDILPGLDIQAGDQIAIVASKPLTVTPDSSYLIRDGARDLAIVALAEFQPGATSFVWQFVVREAGQ